MSESPDPIADLDALLGLLALYAGARIDGATEAGTPLADVGLDSLGVTLVSILLSERGVELTDDDWIGIRTAGDLWHAYDFRRTNPAPI